MANSGKPDGVVRLGDLEITSRELHPDYKIEKHVPMRGHTGLLLVFSLVRKDGNNPSFTARIDDGVPDRRRMPDLDIDIRGVGENIQRDFKTGRNGYDGHHTDKSPNPSERKFDVNIVTPIGTIFRGEVSFKAHFVMLMGTAKISLTADQQHRTKNDL